MENGMGLFSSAKAFGKTASVLFLLLLSNVAMGQRPVWIATWTASPEAADADPDDALINLNNQTVRERVRVTLGGRQIRIRLSNECSSASVLVGGVSVGTARSRSDVVSGSLRRVTFGKKDTILIPPGAPALSDPVDLPVTDGSEIAISLYFPKRVPSVTGHSLALRRTVISTHGDHTQEIAIEGGNQSDGSVFLSEVLVPAQAKSQVIVAFGDSIVDGDKSTPEMDHNWPSELFRRLQQIPQGSRFAVVNEGIAGNRMLTNGPITSLGIAGLARFDRDAMSVPGVTYIVVLQGINDISFPGAMLGKIPLASEADAPTADEIIGGYQQMIARAHATGIQVIGCTIMPTEGVTIVGYHTELKEHLRQAINHWIRTSKAFDEVIDFDAVMRDPDHPSRLLPRLASEDHLHPNDDGYQRMASAIDLSLFK
jgi:lysophospholipase L1-like esterase